MRNTKHILSYVMLAIGSIFFFSSCGDDDNDINLSLENVLWTVTSISVTNCTNPDDNVPSRSEACTATRCCTIMFSNGTITIVDVFNGGTQTETGTYIISGNTLTISIDTFSNEVTYSISGNILTITDTDIDGCTIVETYVSI